MVLFSHLTKCEDMIDALSTRSESCLDFSTGGSAFCWDGTVSTTLNSSSKRVPKKSLSGYCIHLCEGFSKWALILIRLVKCGSSMTLEVWNSFAYLWNGRRIQGVGWIFDWTTERGRWNRSSNCSAHTLVCIYLLKVNMQCRSTIACRQREYKLIATDQDLQYGLVKCWMTSF